jgi:ribosomal protection tetracycline resistance protein
VLRRLAVPCAIFINKIDRRGADPARVRAEIDRRLATGSGALLLPLTYVLAAGSPGAAVKPVSLTDPVVTDVLTSVDDRLLRAAVDGPRITEAMALRSARAQVSRGAVVPVAAGSALTGAGVPDLLSTLPRILPWARPATRDPSGVIFKIEHGAHGTLAHCRVFGGELRVRNRVGDSRDVITSLERSTPQGWVQEAVVRAGDVARIRGISAARTGGWVGEVIPGRVTRQFPAPALESVVDPVDPAMRGRLFAALRQLADSDPLINLRVDEERAEIAVSLYGEVQKEVIADLLTEQFGVAAIFRPTTTVHLERIRGTGAAHAIVSEKTTPYLATLGFRVEPAPVGAGLVCDLEVERGSMPPAFFTATWEGVRNGLWQGLSGWAIPDVRVTLTHTGYYPRQSHMHQKFNKNMSSVGADFRNLAPVLIHEALRLAGTVVCEPVETFRLEVPASALPAVSVTVARLSGLITGTTPAGDAVALSGTLPTRSVQPLLAQLPELTSGEGVFTAEVTHYTPVAGPPPVRVRIGPDPLDKEEWFRARPR